MEDRFYVEVVADARYMTGQDEQCEPHYKLGGDAGARKEKAIFHPLEPPIV
jgi:hypothetical protein